MEARSQFGTQVFEDAPHPHKPAIPE
jgi:hypothetical protein